MITLFSIVKVVSFLIGVVLLIKLLNSKSEYNRKDNNVNY